MANWSIHQVQDLEFLEMREKRWHHLLHSFARLRPSHSMGNGNYRFSSLIPTGVYARADQAKQD